MIREIPINEPHIFSFEVRGKLSEEDYTTFIPKLENLIEKEEKLSFLIMLKDFEGWSAKAAWQDFKLGLDHDKDLLRIAIVGHSLKDKVMSKLGNLFMETEIKYFESESDALEWLNELMNLAEQDEYLGYRHVLVATDFSDFASIALKKAVEIAKPFGAKVSLIHVAENISAELYPSLGELAVPVMIDNPELEEKHVKIISDDLDALVDKLELSDQSITTEVLVGSPVDSITEYATKNNVDLIVMGSHGRRGLARLLGSSTNGVVNHAPCDILTVV